MPRCQWHELPPAVRAEVQSHTGPILGVTPVEAGSISDFAAVLETRGGRFFCKGAMAGNPMGWMHRNEAKINPYLRPLMDALHEMIDHDLIKRYTEEDLIEVIPLAYMRGRTLNEAFIILDEAQNTTVSQMKMFLTRMGAGSKIVVSGDITQIDLPPHTRSGLVDALARLRGIKGIVSVSLSLADIVRHPLVQRIVDAYDERSKKRR